VQRPRKRLKFENVVPLLFLACTRAYVYKHMYGDFTKDEKEYQDAVCSEAEEGNGDKP